MLRRTPLVDGEHYHVYNRGVNKEGIFSNNQDYQRFLVLLYLANSRERIHISNTLFSYQERSLIEIYRNEKPDQGLVEVLSYSLMPNHYHLLLRQKAPGGISLFMRKVSTAYAMYFNLKYNRSGVLFQGRFRSKHISSSEYFRYILAYIHLNPLTLVEPLWKERNALENEPAARAYMEKYPYSSHLDYIGRERPEHKILVQPIPELLNGANDVEELFDWLSEYRQPITKAPS